MIMGFNSSIGFLVLEQEDGRISRVLFDGEQIEGISGESPLLLEAKRQILAFLSGELKQFDLPIKMPSQNFSAEVYKALLCIPYGKAISYGALADKLGKKGSARAIGNACNKNPLPLIVPCHRVIGSKGEMKGYRGGIPLKEKLLEMEATNYE